MKALHSKLRLKLLLAMLLLLHFMQLIAARHLGDDLLVNSLTKERYATIGPKTSKMSSQQTLQKWFGRLSNKTNTLPEMKVDLSNMKFDPRFMLDSLPICGEGFKLIGNHCRRET